MSTFALTVIPATLLVGLPGAANPEVTSYVRGIIWLRCAALLVCSHLPDLNRQVVMPYDAVHPNRLSGVGRRDG